MLAEDIERRVAHYVSKRDGPIRLDKLSPRVLWVEFADLAPEDRSLVARVMRKEGFAQTLARGVWTRVKPRPGTVTEERFAELVALANAFTDSEGRPPVGLRDLALWLAKQEDAGAELSELIDDAGWESALRCACFVRAA